jgi:uncharacterized phiE125 gp8 family phage protein
MPIVGTPISSAEAVSLTEFKAHRRITHTAEDTLLQSLLTGAIEWCERYTGRKFINANVSNTFDRFTSTLPLQWSTAQTISSIVYIDRNAASATVSSSIYELDNKRLPNTVRLKLNQFWPSDAWRDIVVSYVAGYGVDATAVPEPIKTAIKMLAGHWYEYRELAIETNAMRVVPFAVESILWQYKVQEADS